MTEAPALRIDAGDIASMEKHIERQPEIADAPKWLRNRQRIEVERRPDGTLYKTPVIDITDKRARDAVWEMIAPSMEAEMARSKRFTSQIPQITAVTPRGERREVAAHLEAGLGAKGFRPAVYYGKIQGRRIERWSDGLLYRETPSGDYEPMGVCCLGTPIAPCASPRCGRCA